MTAAPALAWREAARRVPLAIVEATLRAPQWVDEPIPYVLTAKAVRLLDGEALCRCLSCRLLVPVLVDDSEMCVSCDALLYPARAVAR